MANVTLSASSATEEQATPFVEALLKKLAAADDHKPGAVVRMVQPLLLAHPLESMEPEGERAVPKYGAAFFNWENFRWARRQTETRCDI